MKDCSYMEVSLHLDGQDCVYLRVPTIWDDIEKTWRGIIKTPKTKKLICSAGKDSFELLNNFEYVISASCQESKEMTKEIFSMFRPQSFWEKQK